MENRWKDYNPKIDIHIYQNKLYCFVVKTISDRMVSSYVGISVLYFVNNKIEICGNLTHKTGSRIFVSVHPTKPIITIHNSIYKFDPVKKQFEEIKFKTNIQTGPYIAMIGNRLISRDYDDTIDCFDINDPKSIDRILVKEHDQILTSPCYPEIFFVVSRKREKLTISIYKEFIDKKFKLLIILNLDPEITKGKEIFPEMKINVYKYISVSFGEKTYFLNTPISKKYDWRIHRLLWIGKYKNQSHECIIASLPREIIAEIVSYLSEFIYCNNNEN